MIEYAKLYFSLFNAITDACRAIRAGAPGAALDILEAAQLTAEHDYVESAESSDAERKAAY